MNGFFITISNGLLKDNHRKRMGTAVWEFMWCIDKVTRIDEDGVGWVLGGKAINLSDLAEVMDVGEDTVSVNLSKLENEGYISKTRTPNGLVIKVANAKKRFGKISRRVGKTPNPLEETPNAHIDNTIDNTETKRSLKYLKEIPERDLNEFYVRFDASKEAIKSKAEDLLNWCEANGKRKRNYKSFLLNALKKDFPLRKIVKKEDMKLEEGRSIPKEIRDSISKIFKK